MASSLLDRVPFPALAPWLRLQIAAAPRRQSKPAGRGGGGAGPAVLPRRRSSPCCGA